MIINPLEGLVHENITAHKLTYLNGLITTLIDEWGGQPPDELSSGIQRVMGLHRFMFSDNYDFRIIAKWGVDGTLARETMQTLQDFYQRYSFPRSVIGIKDPASKTAKPRRYVDLNGRVNSRKKGYFFTSAPFSFNNHALGIWAMRNFRSKDLANTIPRSIPGKWFYEGDSYSLELRKEALKEMRYVELPVQISHILQTGEMIPRDQLLYEICRSLATYGIKPKTKEDVGGLDGVLDELLWRVLAPFKNPEAARHYGLTPESVILVGVPGVGKTLLANVLAHMEYNAVFVPIDAWSLIHTQTEKNEEDILFNQLSRLQESAGIDAILHVDDIESALQDPEQTDMGKENLAASSKLLTKMKGLTESTPLIGSTNKPWQIDPRFLQFGRFTRVIYVPRPDGEARKRILDIHLESSPLEDTVNYGALIPSTKGWTGEHIMQLCREAGRFAAKRATGGDFEKLSELTTEELQRYPINAEDFANAHERTVHGIDIKEIEEMDKRIREFCAKFDSEYHHMGFETPSKDGHRNGAIFPEQLMRKVPAPE